MLLPALALALAAPATAHADVLVQAAPGAKNLAAGGGYAAWAAPRSDGRWQLVVRDPAGAVAPAAVKTFGAAPDSSIGADAFAISKHVVVVYSRCAGTSTTKDCDVFRYDLATRKESKVPNASSKTYSEVAPSIASGRVSFVRRSGGSNTGVYIAVSGTEYRAAHLNRIDGHIARETAISQSRVTFLYRNSKGQDDITLAQLDGSRRRLIVRSAPSILFNPVITRYRVGWLERRDAVIAKMTDRINPSDAQPTVRSGKRPLPATTQSAVTDSSNISAYLDDAGYTRIAPPIFPNYG